MNLERVEMSGMSEVAVNSSPSFTKHVGTIELDYFKIPKSLF